MLQSQVMFKLSQITVIKKLYYKICWIYGSIQDLNKCCSLGFVFVRPGGLGIWQTSKKKTEAGLVVKDCVWYSPV